MDVTELSLDHALKYLPHRETRTETSRDDYGTPWPIVKYLATLTERGCFAVDACAQAHNAKSLEWLGPGSQIDEDALGVDVMWGQHHHRPEAIFCNPPYHDLRSWCSKAVQQAECGREVVMLMPARTDTTAFHSMATVIRTMVFFKGRISFEINGVPQKGTMFPSLALVLTGMGCDDRQVHKFPVVKDIMEDYK